ncbi:MAG: serine/threonine protein kinase [Candidatus Accumulibacter sp.]|nr:serine/threonine protein kinase [Accumulibacter sp.]
MALSDLEKTGRRPKLPLTIRLPGVGAPELHLESLLRVLPGRRYVGVALWSDRGLERKVLAKLLVGKKAKRDFMREKRGNRLLCEQDLSTPALWADFFSEKEGGVLLFEYLEGAHSLGERWKALEDAARTDALRVVKDAFCAVAELHSKGLWQEDLHPDNLLYQKPTPVENLPLQGDNRGWERRNLFHAVSPVHGRGLKHQEGRLFFVDAGSVSSETPGSPLSPEKALENLGVFFAQFPSRIEGALQDWLDAYAEVNSSCRARFTPSALRAAIDRAKRRRIDDLMKKTGRDCSLFRVEKKGFLGAFGFCAVRRDEAEALARILAEPDAFIARGHIFKAGRTATVARVEDRGRLFVVKRYNVKNFWHWLGRFWRPSRAWTSWRGGNRLDALGIPTAKPLAMIERRWMGLRGTAYLITEYLEGRDIMTFFRDAQQEKAGIPPSLDIGIAALRELFAALRRDRVSHGDFKGNNLIWRGGGDRGAWVLIDLDAMRAHHSASEFSSAYARDRDRLLRNWLQDSPVFRRLNAAIPASADERDEF